MTHPLAKLILEFLVWKIVLMKPLKNIAIVFNATKLGAEDAGQLIKKLAQSHGLSVSVTDQFPLPDAFIKNADACFVMGGDGTLLSLLKQAVEFDVPVAGFRYGKLGFMATFSPEDIELKLPKILKGNYKIGRRNLLTFRHQDGEENLALNDLVVKSGSNGRLARFSVFADQERVADYACDGMVFSTPTGSTAYNLAAGGPIAHPNARVVLMTPICAHTLTSRSVIFPEGVTLRVHANDNPDEPLISADGQPAFEGQPSFPLEISVSPLTFPLLEELDHCHFRVLRNKLKWD